MPTTLAQDAGRDIAALDVKIYTRKLFAKTLENE